jgi:hypothetical protein
MVRNNAAAVMPGNLVGGNGAARALRQRTGAWRENRTG